ncbi:MAG TPA: 3-hydroxybutyrate dehydrogenase [Alphaproteobacteria bacterium]|nr:3-hydroxybutyrate dehydrogenase [Alphaproteobacteria bacterium]HNS44560.1 3-hydroxybutyrate dehydrogenase [Alphaproteobacteria bacterium]
MSLKGKVAFVTGSTSGIGLGVARKMAEAGADVALNGFGDAAEIEKTRAGLESEFGVRVIFVPADVTKYDEVEAAVVHIQKDLGSLDILVNNAGIQHVSPVEDFPIDMWQKVIDINLTGVFYGIRAAMPGMKQKGWGRIINIASVHGLVASINKTAYVASKHAVVGLTKVVALEVARMNITSNAICPGWVLTPLIQKQIDDRAAKSGRSVEEETEALLSEKQPNVRFALPEEVGALAVFLCSEEARGITGTTHSIDGGWSTQ